MKSMSLKSMSALALALVAGGALATTTSVSAEDTTGKVKFTAGDLIFSDGATATVPSFDFGSHQVSSTAQTYNATAAGTLAVTDLRGTGAGWNVTVKQKGALTSTSGHTLTAAQLKLDQGTTTNSNNETVTATAQTLTVGTAAKVFDATVNNGNGVSTLTWATTQTHLEVPAGTTQKAEEYTATLEWTLNDTPA